jgi:hypothetical protein
LVALQLFLVLPLVAGGRLALDAGLTHDLTRGVEATHDSGCKPLHDHELCVHLYRTPWSEAVRRTPGIRIGAVVQRTAPADEAPRDDPLARFPVARSPPLL